MNQGNNFFNQGANKQNIFSNPAQNNQFMNNQGNNVQANNMFSPKNGPLIGNTNMNANIFQNNMGNNQMGNPMSNNMIGNNPMGNNMMGNNPMGNNMIGNNPMGNNMNNNNPMNNNMLGNNMGNNMLGNNMGNNMLGNNQMGNNIFNNMGNNQMGNQNNNVFANQNMGNNNQNMGNNIFSNNMNPNMNNNVFANTQMNYDPNMGLNQYNQYGNLNIPHQSSGEFYNLKHTIQELNSKLNPQNINCLSLLPSNKFLNEKINKFPQFKPLITQIMKNFGELKQAVDKLKSQSAAIEAQSADYSEKVLQRLECCKEKLIQSISQGSLIEEVKREIQSMDKQMKEFFKPLYNAYVTRQHYPFVDPDYFCLEVSQEILRKMNVLNSKVDDVIACRTADQGEVYDTVGVMEQLIQYYQNVAARISEFQIRYNKFKKAAIERKQRGTYEDTMRKIREKVNTSLSKEFKIYDLIREIDQIVDKREKKTKKM